MGGVTDALIETGSLAEKGNVEFQIKLKDLREKHRATARKLLDENSLKIEFDLHYQFFRAKITRYSFTPIICADLPLVVKGAGAEVTAAGVFADIIRAVNF